MRMRTLLTSLIIALGAACAFGQLNILALLQQLGSPDYPTRMMAFTTLKQAGFPGGDQTRVAVIALLDTENAYAQEDGPEDDQWATYYSDLVGTIAGFRDVRSLNELLPVIQSGSMVTDALASFGNSAASGVLGKLSSTDPTVAVAAAITLRKLLDPANPNGVTDESLKSQAKSALENAILNSDPDIKLSALLALLQFFNIQFAGKPTVIGIDIKPGSYPNPINPRINGVIPVAILGSSSFDATSVDTSTVRFGPDQAVPTAGIDRVDVNNDGYLDIVVHFATQSSGITCSDTATFLFGKTTSGQQFVGSDSVLTVGCH